MNIPFSPPDISEREIESVVETLRSGWITTGPNKEIENKLRHMWGQTCCLSEFLNGSNGNDFTSSGNRAEGMKLLFNIYLYGELQRYLSCGRNACYSGYQQDHPEMDYIKVAEAITERTKVIIPVDLAGIVCDYETLYRVLEGKKSLFHANTKWLQKHFDRIIVMSDSAHGFGAIRDEKTFRVFSRFYLLLFSRNQKSDYSRKVDSYMEKC